MYFLFLFLRLLFLFVYVNEVGGANLTPKQDWSQECDRFGTMTSARVCQADQSCFRVKLVPPALLKYGHRNTLRNVGIHIFRHL